jgi:prepilin-type N-terminal cleavage/methylation domain-containing protein
MKCSTTHQSAFSLIELLAVVTILGIIAALVLPRITVSTDRTKETTCVHNRAEINISVERYYLHTGQRSLGHRRRPQLFPERRSDLPLDWRSLSPRSHDASRDRPRRHRRSRAVTRVLSPVGIHVKQFSPGVNDRGLTVLFK